MNPTIRSATSSLESIPCSLLLMLSLGLCLLLPVPAIAAVDRQAYPTEAPAGLQEVDSNSFDVLYVKPGFQPGDYGKLIIEEPEVAMHDSWERQHRGDFNQRDLKHIESSTARILRKQFGEKLSARDGYTLVESEDVKGKGVLRLKPSMIDLHLNAPDLLSEPARKETFVRSAGHATLYLDLYDAVTGELLLRVIDRDSARYNERLYEANRGTNNQDLRIMASRWATALRRHLDSLNSGTS